MKHFDNDFLLFFMDLARNNNKEWFDANRKRYRKSVKEPFENFVLKVAEVLKQEEKLGEAKASDYIFRINKDIRFSKDKTPYKTNVSALLSPGGRKNMNYPALYFEMGPENLGIYTGHYMPDTQKVQKIREHIARNPERFDSIISEKRFLKLYGEVLGEKQVRIPKELKKASETQPLIFNKQFYITHTAEPDIIVEGDVLKYVLDTYATAKPFVEFMREI